MKKNKKLIKIIISSLIVIILITFFAIHKGIIFPKVVLSDEKLTLNVGDNAIISYETNNNSRIDTWYSENPEIVTIDKNGLIKAIKNGETRIYLQYGNKRKYCVITVNSILVDSISLNKKEIEMSLEDEYQLEYSILPLNATDQSITWESSNNLVATVNNGLIKATGLGETDITIKTNNGISDKCHVIVNNIRIKELRLDKNEISLNKGSVYKLNVQIIPSNASDNLLSYKVDNPNVIEVTNEGLIKANQSGLANVTISSSTGVTTSCKVNVSNNEIISYKSEYLPNNGQKLIINVNEDDYAKLVVNTYLNGNIQSNKSINEKINNYQLEASGIGKWDVEFYLIYNDDIESKKYQYHYGMATTKTIKNNLDREINNINFDENSNTLLFGSDYQGGEAKGNVKSLFTTINSLNIKIGLFGFLGDYSTTVGNAASSGSGLNSLNNQVRSFSNLQNAGTVYIQGNHDPDNTKHLSKLGEYEANKYALFLINEDDYPRSASNGNSAKKTAEKLDEYLSNLVKYEVRKPVFVLTHVPLHHSRRADNSYASYLVDVLNKYGDKLDIIFMYGHNHSNTYDDCLGGSINYIAKGQSMKHFSFDGTGKKIITTSTIKFTYLNAGYVGYIRNSNKDVNCDTGIVRSYNVPTLSLFTINEKKITVERYGISGKLFTNNIARIN